MAKRFKIDVTFLTSLYFLLSLTLFRFGVRYSTGSTVLSECLVPRYFSFFPRRARVLLLARSRGQYCTVQYSSTRRRRVLCKPSELVLIEIGRTKQQSLSLSLSLLVCLGWSSNRSPVPSTRLVPPLSLSVCAVSNRIESNHHSTPPLLSLSLSLSVAVLVPRARVSSHHVGTAAASSASSE